jgi:TRAP-type C4-dicarboxylate transport system permease small subunit
MPSSLLSLPARALIHMSRGIAKAERLALTVLMGGLLLLVLLNVVTRFAGTPLYWVDEAAVYSVVWLSFVGASVMTRLRMDFAVTMLTDMLGPRAAKAMKVLATVFVVSFGFALLAMCWIWMDPVGIARFGFDAKEYAAESFNFLYTERTQTLNWPTWVVQLILPLFALTFTVHALANLVEDLELVPRVPLVGFPSVALSEVN